MAYGKVLYVHHTCQRQHKGGEREQSCPGLRSSRDGKAVVMTMPSWIYNINRCNVHNNKTTQKREEDRALQE